MLEFRKKKVLRKVMYSPWTLTLLAFFVVFVTHAAWNVHKKERVSAEALDRTQREYEKLAAREATLANSVKYLATPQGIETEIRQKFRVAKEGESVAVILNDKATTSTTTPESEHDFWYRLKHLF